MFKIIDRTSGRNPKGFLDISLWDDDVIGKLANKYKTKWCKHIVVINAMVDEYNQITKQYKSDFTFVKRVKKLNKEGYFDAKDKR
jgi:hypothetical protein